MAHGMNSPVDALLMWICFKAHNVTLYCDSGKRWTTNCASLFAFIHLTRPDLTAAFLEGISMPGYAAHQAIQNFLAAVIPWLNPAVHTLAGLLLAGLTFSRDQPAAADARDMVRIAVRCSGSLEEQITMMERNGYFERKYCGPGDITMEPGFLDFDPSTTMGRQRWSQVLRLLQTRFKQPACKITELRNVKTLWLQHMQGDKTAHRFMTDDDVLYEPVALAGGQYPDQLRIEVTKPRFNEKTTIAFDSFVSQKICAGQYDQSMETDWTTFTETMARVGVSVMKGASAAASSIPAASAVPAASGILDYSAAASSIPAASPVPAVSHPIGDKSLPAGSCWRYTHAGTCDLDEKDCRFSHPGEIGAHKHTVADDDGFCKTEKRRGHCSRDQCPFRHAEDVKTSGPRFPVLGSRAAAKTDVERKPLQFCIMQQRLC